MLKTMFYTRGTYGDDPYFRIIEHQFKVSDSGIPQVAHFDDGSDARPESKKDCWQAAQRQQKPVRVEYLDGSVKELGVVYVRPLHIKDQQNSATVVPWHTATHHAPDDTVMCDGDLKTTQEAWADVTRCNKCAYYSYWGIGD